MFHAKLRSAAALSASAAVLLTLVLVALPLAAARDDPARPAEASKSGATAAGRVLDPDGRPVAGDDDRPEPPKVVGLVVDEAGRPVARAEVRSFPFTFLEATGTTGPDGTFAFPARRLASDSLLLLARDVDGRRMGFFRRGTATLRRREFGAPVRVVLKPGRDLVVRVTGPDGAPVAGAAVEAVGVASAMTGADGRAALRVPIDARIPWVFALKPGLGFDFAEFGPIEPGMLDRGAPAAEVPATIDLALDGARTVRIRAVDSAGRPAAGVPFFPPLLQVDKRHSSALIAGSRATIAATNAEGVATFDWLPDGKDPVSFVLSSDEFSTSRLALQDDSGTATILAVRLYSKGEIRGRVTMPDGAPAIGVLVAASGRGRGADVGFGRARTGADGSYTMSVASDAAYLVSIDDDDWAAPTREEVVVREGGPTAGVNFRLERGTVVRGTVAFGPDRRPAPGRAVVLTERRGAVPPDLDASPRPEPLQSSRSTMTEPDGAFSLRVARGTYTLTLRESERSLRPETIEVTDQAEVVRDIMVRRETGPISGRVVFASEPGRGVAGAKVEAIATTDPRAMGFAATADADGRFRGQRRFAPIVMKAASPDGKLAGIADVGVAADADAVEVVIPIGPTATASGRALDDRGLPIGNMPIDCDIERPANYVWRIGHEATTDALGRFTVTGLVVGQSYRVSLAMAPNRPAYLTTVIARAPGLIDMDDLQLGAAGVRGSFRDDAPRPGAPAPPIRGTSLDDRPIAPDQFRGKYVLLAFWGTWCGACLDELPALQAVHDTFGVDPRFAMVFLSVDGSIDAPRRFVAGRKLPGLQGFIGPRLPGSTSDDFGVRGVPATILLGPDGKIVARGMRGEAIKEAVRKALKEASDEPR